MKSILTILLAAIVFTSGMAQEQRIFRIYVLGDHLEINKPKIILTNLVNDHNFTFTPSFPDSIDYQEVELIYGKNILIFKNDEGYNYSEFIDTLEIDDKTPQNIYYLNSHALRTCEAVMVTKSEIKTYRKNKRKLRKLKRLAFLNKIHLVEIGNFKIEIQ